MPKIPGGFKSTSSGVLKPWRQSGDPGRSNLLSFCLCSMMYSLKVGLLEWQRFKEISYVYLHNTPIAVQMLHPQPVVSLSLASNMICTCYPHCYTCQAPASQNAGIYPRGFDMDSKEPHWQLHGTYSSKVDPLWRSQTSTMAEDVAYPHVGAGTMA